MKKAAHIETERQGRTRGSRCYRFARERRVGSSNDGTRKNRERRNELMAWRQCANRIFIIQLFHVACVDWNNVLFFLFARGRQRVYA